MLQPPLKPKSAADALDAIQPVGPSGEDIVSIAEEGIRNFGAFVAKRYHDELFALLELIASNPKMTRERHEISPPVRIHPFKAHLVVYRVVGDGSIFVIRIRHGHEDWVGDSL